MAQGDARRRLRMGAVVGAALAVGVGIGFLAGRAGDGSEPESPVRAVSALGRVPEPLPQEPPDDAPLPPPSALPPEAQVRPEAFADREGREELETIPPTVEYPVLDKLVAEPMSPVRHEVLGAWDEARESDVPGRRRAFVLVVAPEATDAEIESLARDVRARHRDASILDVRIYDDARATLQSRALDGGRLAFQHLVGEVKRNEAMDLDVIRVRGRRVEL